VEQKSHMHIRSDAWVQINGDAVFGILLFVMFCVFDAVLDRSNLIEIGLTLLASLALGSVIGWRYTWVRRHPLEHERSHIKLTISITVVMWTVFVIGLALVGWARGLTDGRFGEQILILLTVGQLFMMFLGAVWGMSIRVMDWYPLRRTRASMMRLIGLYLLTLILVVAASLVAMSVAQWVALWAYTGIVLGWLVIARLWRG